MARTRGLGAICVITGKEHREHLVCTPFFGGFVVTLHFTDMRSQFPEHGVADAIFGPELHRTCDFESPSTRAKPVLCKRDISREIDRSSSSSFVVVVRSN